MKRSTEGTSIGQILNVLTNDLNRFDDIFWMFWYIVIAPFEIFVVYVIIWNYVGYPCATGLIFVFLFIAGQSVFAKFTNKFRLSTTKITDSRIKLMSEIINAMKVIKMYAWEHSFAERIATVRLNEIKQLKKSMAIRLIVYIVSELVSKILVFATILSILFFGFKLNAEITFVIITLFNVIRFPIGFFLPMGIGYIAEILVTLRRVNEILILEEQSCAISDGSPVEIKGEIKFKSFSGKWTNTSEHCSLKSVTANIKSGELVFVIGPVGSGKTCLLMAILHEIEKVSGDCVVSGCISYSPQEAWCFNGSVKQNIIFGRNFDKNKYDNVIDVCGLVKDFKLFSFGDETLIGEKGITLSGGQKARVNLARLE
ncbi:multidrug resistance-associated protein 4-like protein [Leptotrombidium deliense]|uniref:Multidrug resistance-associated protein 4-like protein n=1 Tax=Leptotrombidium deliense TaxID=299467 RepID=A0A443S6W1_9ACAR|nr:multidrug resistance-associated protein 4-like protein [Leptotrombidium deliense]